MKVAFAKPSFGTVGGFESVLSLLRDALLEQGHSVDILEFEVPNLPTDALGMSVPRGVSHAAVEAIRFFHSLERFQRLDTSGYDLVVSTQAPTYAIRHERHLSVFYHHLRIYYDLSDAYIAAGMAVPWDHFAAQSAVRTLDRDLLQNVHTFLAPPNTRKRLHHYNGLTNVRDFWAGSDIGEALSKMSLSETFEEPIVVNRQEFPKRTEIFVHAMKYLPHITGVVLGGGGRMPWLKHVDRKLSRPGFSLDEVTAKELWLNPGISPSEDGSEEKTNVIMLDRVTQDELIERYRNCLCVVATAFQEDYGLTAIEAMAAGKPLIVPKDGGGLLEFVEEGLNGFVVEPTGRAIAEAISRFHRDRGLAQRMGTAGREMFGSFTSSRGTEAFLEAVEELAS